MPRGTPWRHKGAGHWTIRKDGEDGMSLSRDTSRGSQFIAFQTCLGFHGASSVPLQASPPWGRLAPCLHPFWVRRHLLGCLRATGTLEFPPSRLHSVPPAPPQSQVHPQGCLLPGVQQVPPLSAFAFKKGLIIRPSPPTPWDALKGSIQHQTQHPCSFPIPWFPAWKMLTSLPVQENPHSGRTTF